MIGAEPTVVAQVSRSVVRYLCADRRPRQAHQSVVESTMLTAPIEVRPLVNQILQPPQLAPDQNNAHKCEKPGGPPWQTRDRDSRHNRASRYRNDINNRDCYS